MTSLSEVVDSVTIDRLARGMRHLSGSLDAATSLSALLPGSETTPQLFERSAIDVYGARQ